MKLPRFKTDYKTGGYPSEMSLSETEELERIAKRKNDRNEYLNNKISVVERAFTGRSENESEEEERA